MVGKLTKDNMPSCSILATAAGHNPWQTPNECIDKMIKADSGENVRTEQTAIMSRGDTLEPVLLNTAIKELCLDYGQTDILLPIVHTEIPLQGSLDGLCYAPDGMTIKEDPEKGIYVMTDSKEITISGEGVMECKLTSAYPEDEPPLWRGPMQLQGLMDIKGASYGVLVVCYQSVHWRYFIYPRNEAMVAQIHELVLDLDRRVKEKDYFPVASPKDASVVYPETNEDHLDLDEEALDHIDLYNSAKKAIKGWQDIKDKAQVELMSILGENTTGSVAVNSGLTKTTFVVKWGMRTVKPRPSKVVPEEPGYTVRSNSISIKEITDEL